MEEKMLNITVSFEFDKFRLDKFLQNQLKNYSRTKLQNLIKEGCVKLNNNIIYETSKKIKNKDKIDINLPKPKETSIKPYKMSLDILYEDSDLIIINKSPGTVIHPGAGNYDTTIVNALLFKYQKNLSSVGGKLRPGIVHRIDKDTSGAVVVAKNDKSHISLSKQFAEHSINRTYEALVWGSLRPKIGKINENISRSIKNRQLMEVRRDKKKGKRAVTNYKTVDIYYNSNLPKISLIECSLETGRTHQIRVHMNFKGNPIIGDKSYGKLKYKFKNINENIKKQIDNFDRQALHAKSLGFIHPTSCKKMFFEAKRPEDFNRLIKSLKKASV